MLSIYSVFVAKVADTFWLGVDLGKKTDRRKETRHPIDWPITVMADHGDIEGRARDVSADGMSIISDQPLYLGEICWARVSPPGYPEMEVTVKVIWSDLYGIDEKDEVVGVGVCFLQVSMGDRRLFQDIITAQTREK